jgi:hypothetical protein
MRTARMPVTQMARVTTTTGKITLVRLAPTTKLKVIRMERAGEGREEEEEVEEEEEGWGWGGGRGVQR